jgi:hypothetical protein
LNDDIHVPGWTTNALFHEYCAKLAQALFDRGKRPTQGVETRLYQIRKILLDESRSDQELALRFIGADHIFRVLFPQSDPSFSISACGGREVVYYRVALVVEGDIRQDSGKLTNPSVAIEMAERWFALVAWPGTSIALLAALDSGQIILCGERKVR